MPIEELVKHYTKCWKPLVIQENEWFGVAASLEHAVRRACKSRDRDGLLHRHQWRLRRHVYCEATKALSFVMKQLSEASDFERIFIVVEQHIGPISGAGEMYIYDVAERIGMFRKIYPEKIYLHRGTRVGAVALGCNGNLRSIRVEEIHPDLGALTPSEAESFLCLYERNLRDPAAPLPEPPDHRGGCRG